MCRQVPVARPGCERAGVCAPRPEPASRASEESGLQRGSTPLEPAVYGSDCTQQGILFGDERKNIQQPVFALGVLDTLPRFGIRHMHVVGVKLLSAGQTLSLLLSSPRPSLPRGRGAQRGCGHPTPPGRKDSPPHATPQRGSHLGRPPALLLAARPPPPSRARGARAWAVLREPAPAWGPLTARPVEYCISWL